MIPTFAVVKRRDTLAWPFGYFYRILDFDIVEGVLTIDDVYNILDWNVRMETGVKGKKYNTK